MTLATVTAVVLPKSSTSFPLLCQTAFFAYVSSSYRMRTLFITCFHSFRLIMIKGTDFPYASSRYVTKDRKYLAIVWWSSMFTDCRDFLTLLNLSTISFHSTVKKYISNKASESKRSEASVSVDVFSLVSLTIIWRIPRSNTGCNRDFGMRHSKLIILPKKDFGIWL